MKVKSITISEYPPEQGPPSERLLITLENGYNFGISIDHMQSLDADELALEFERLARHLRNIPETDSK